MAVPKKKVSKSRRDSRRANYKIQALNLVACPKCGAPRLPHSICETCGAYKDRVYPRSMLKASLVAS